MHKKAKLNWPKIILSLIIILLPFWYKLMFYLFMKPTGNPPRKIAFFRIIKEANSDYVYGYFAMYDSRNIYTSLNGDVRVEIFQDVSDISTKGKIKIWEMNKVIKDYHFKRRVIGTGIFKRAAIICPLFFVKRSDILNTDKKKSLTALLTVKSNGRLWQKEIKIKL